MSATPFMPPSGFDDLQPEEKLDYVQSLWDRIAQEPDKVPSPEWHRAEIDDRLDALERDGNPGRPWVDVREELLQRLRDVRR